MAWIRSNKKSGEVIETINVYSGRIALNNGTIVADNDYCYTDFIPFSSGKQIINVGESNTSAGSCWYKEDGTYGGNYWGATGRYMEVNNTSYAATVKKQRITFRKIYLDEVMIIDEVLNKAYGLNFVKIVE